MSWGRDLPWDCIFVDQNGDCIDKLTVWKYIVNIIPNWWYEIKKDGNSQLYICDRNGLKIYTNDNISNAWCIKSDFRRYIKINSYPNSNNIFTINSIVEYNKNGFTGEVNLESTIGNI